MRLRHPVGNRMLHQKMPVYSFYRNSSTPHQKTPSKEPYFPYIPTTHQKRHSHAWYNRCGYMLCKEPIERALFSVYSYISSKETLTRMVQQVRYVGFPSVMNRQHVCICKGTGARGVCLCVCDYVCVSMCVWCIGRVFRRGFVQCVYLWWYLGSGCVGVW